MSRPLLLLLWAAVATAAAAANSRPLWQWEAMARLQPEAEETRQATAVRKLLERLLGPKASSAFAVSVNRSLGGPGGLDTYRLSSEKPGTINVSGSSGVAAASGIYHYLKDFCGCHVSWSGRQLRLPQSLPPVSAEIIVTSPNRFRFYQNVCTYSYSFVWWNWDRWEQEIDWMALHGINMALAFTGQEAIWQRVYLSLGLKQSEIDEYFTGPAFLAWNRMGNLHSWAGPLPFSWHQKKLNLQNAQLFPEMGRLLDQFYGDGGAHCGLFCGFALLLHPDSFTFPVQDPREDEVSGYVDSASRILWSYPARHSKVNATQLGNWSHFDCTYSCAYLLSPEDPMFQVIGTLFLKELIKEFGTDHVYSADTFNEMRPLSSNTTYLSQVSTAVFHTMTGVDPDAIWLMQGWLFQHQRDFWQPAQVKALLQGVPIGRMLVLDLFAESKPVYLWTESFYGQPFIWCMLHNFGGNHGLFGMVESINQGPFEARRFLNSTMIGIGLTPEGIEQNDVIYELITDLGWLKEPVNLQQWVATYSTERYGVKNMQVIKAWQLLFQSVYNCSGPCVNHNHSPLVHRPSFRMNTEVWYNKSDVYEAWQLFQNTSGELGNSSTFSYDLVDVVRQVLQQRVSDYYLEIKQAFQKRVLSQLLITGSVLIYDLLPELDALLSSDSRFLLGGWLEAAHKMAASKKEEQLYDFNARNQLTLWGPDGNILDYANKQLAGLMLDYYRMRWKLFIITLVKCLNSGTPFHQDQFNQAVIKVERRFIYNGKQYPSKPIGNTLDIATKIYLKYYPLP